MTAEIAILNRTAVTLASDSAVTIQVGRTEKIYNTADKLFELTVSQPIGLMIFNNMNFLEVPYEVLVKDFRSKRGTNVYQTVEACAEDFLNYLEQEIARETPKAVLQKQIADRFRFELLRIRQGWGASLERHFASTKPRANPALFAKLLSEEISRALKAIERRPINSKFQDLPESEILSGIAETIKVAMGSFDLPLTDDQRRDLERIAVQIVRRDVESRNFTGLVFAGFGKDRLFPSLRCYHIDGVALDRLKVREARSVDIDHDGTQADIVPFAQQEMVDRFLYGIDSEFQDGVERFVRTTVQSSAEQLVEAVGVQPKKKKALMASAKDMGERAAQKFRDEAGKAIKENFKKRIMDMVLFMPKQELANMAESLVNLTSTKRKVSSERETVGGPIDVAVISRSDGFVWVRRKHYFDAALNPRYFVRHFGSGPSPGGTHGRT